MNSIFTFPRGLLLATFAMLVGCATLAPAPAVSLSVVDLRSLESTMLETKLELVLRLNNESTQPLALAGSTHRLFFNDTLVGRAVSSDTLNVPALGTGTPKITVYLDNLTLLRKAAEFSQVPAKLAYRLESRLQPADGAWFGEIRVTTSGVIDLAGLGLPMPGK